MTDAFVRMIGGYQIGREVIPTDNLSLQITMSRLAVLSIQSRGLYRYLAGSIERPKERSPLYDKWIAENSLVMSWLLHLIQPNFDKGYEIELNIKDIREFT